MIEFCRTDGHEWDETPIGTMFQPRTFHITQTSTCLRCGVRRTYDNGQVRWSYPEKEET